MEIIGDISNFSENFKSAVEITNCLNKAKIMMIEKVLCELEKRVDIIIFQKS